MDGEILVRVADIQATAGPETLVTLGLGSCVAIMLYDPTTRVGGLAHILLPSRSLSRAVPSVGRTPQTAIPALMAELVRLGGDRRRLTARIAGGACMFANLGPSGSVQMGERNVFAVREVLHAHALPIVGESVGGSRGRSVWFTPANGVVRVRVVGRTDVEL
jgi:chemotaxis protein CheD